MSNTISNQVHELIHSMTPAEKAYFKKYTSLHVLKDGNSYVKLFDAINSQKAYDEDRIKKRFRGERFTRNLSAAKNYLYNLILKSLSNYESKDTVQQTIRENLRSVELLYKRGLDKQAMKILKKTRTLSEKHESFFELLDVLKWERRFLISSQKRNLETKLSEILEHEKVISDNLVTDREYSDMWQRLFLKTEVTGRKIEDDELEEIIQHPLLKNPSKATTFNTRQKYHRIYSNYWLAKGDAKLSLEHSQRIIELWQSYPHMIKSLPLRYMMSINNVLSDAIRCGDFQLSQDLIDRLKDMSLSDVKLKAQRFKTLALFETELWLAQRKFDDALEGVTFRLAGLNEYEKYLAERTKLSVWCHMAYVFFMNERYDDAQTMLQKVVPYDKEELRYDTVNFSKLLELLIHFEIGNMEFLSYRYNSNRAYVCNNHYSEEIENLVLKLIGELLKQKKRGSRVNAVTSFLEDSEKIYENQSAEGIYKFCRFDFWAERKLRSI